MAHQPADPSLDYAYELPSELIAREPAARRGDARLLLVDPSSEQIREMRFRAMSSELREGDVLVINDTRVLPARLYGRRRPGGGRVEFLLLSSLRQGVWSALARPSRKLQPGDRLDLETEGGSLLESALSVVSTGDQGAVAVAGTDRPLEDLMAEHGRMPVPPYIVAARREDGLDTEQDLDRRRYQTVYADQEGSVAAPTAGLHFEDSLLEDLASQGVTVATVTLHVGVGTFRNPDERDLKDRRLHQEHVIYPASTDAALVSARSAGGRVIAVGTTSLRVLETVTRLGLSAEADAGAERVFGEDEERPEFRGRAIRRAGGWEIEGATHLFVRPPDVITGADALITNFHLPGSSLLMLVASAMGGRRWRRVYEEAVDRGCRFYSYGDAMMIAPLAGRQERGADA